VTEADLRQLIQSDMERRLGRTLVLSGVQYVIAAYNDMAPVPGMSEEARLIGVEWSWGERCPAGRTCAQGPYDDAACFAVRAGSRGRPRYTFHCLRGSDMVTTGSTARPLRYRDAFVATRALRPWATDGGVYFGGYDCNSRSSEGTAWIARGNLLSLRHLAK
jgi:hypothetical protein